MKDNKNIVNQYEHPSFLASALTIHGSVTPRVAKHVLAATLYACCISLLSLVVPSLNLPITPFEYAGLVMGLILVFRINAGYERWWEARKLWGNLVNNSRNLAIILRSYTHDVEKSQLQKISGFLKAMPFLMKNSLRGNSSCQEVEPFLEPDVYQEVMASTHRPNYISTKLADSLATLLSKNQLDHFAYLKAEERREVILDCQGACERILKTPMPYVMAIKSRRFILLFLIILPIGLVNYSAYISPLITALVAYAFFALDQIGIELQNPFSPKNLSHLPLGEISRAIELNINEIFSQDREAI